MQKEFRISASTIDERESRYFKSILEKMFQQFYKRLLNEPNFTNGTNILV